jgi:hypothetical protein
LVLSLLGSLLGKTSLKVVGKLQVTICKNWCTGYQIFWDITGQFEEEKHQHPVQQRPTQGKGGGWCISAFDHPPAPRGDPTFLFFHNCFKKKLYITIN